jgi:predicted metal-dependent hydrolase
VHVTDPVGCDVLAVNGAHHAYNRAHATHALAAGAAYRRPGGGEGEAFATAVRRAAALWDARLFFEVHEVLEAVWQRAGGETRQALQGLIQIAVAFYHLAAGNLRGARQLVTDGRARLAAAADALPLVDAAALLDLTAPWEAALASSRAVPAGAAPRFPLRPRAPGA